MPLSTISEITISPIFAWVSSYILIYFIPSMAGSAVGPRSLSVGLFKFVNVCPFDYTAFVVSGKVQIP